MSEISGAIIFIEIEKPNEVEKHELKKEKSKEVTAAVDYLKQIFWQYATNENRYNYTQEEFSKAVSFEINLHFE